MTQVDEPCSEGCLADYWLGTELGTPTEHVS
jgi:hypothetical protein